MIGKCRQSTPWLPRFPLPFVCGLVVLFAGFLNLFVGSASAKWAQLAPALAPMQMVLGMSPEGATAAYRARSACPVQRGGGQARAEVACAALAE